MEEKNRFVVRGEKTILWEGFSQACEDTEDTLFTGVGFWEIGFSELLEKDG